nr:MAG TPA: hypothetical protein [Caudoviricetes sp.]
MFRTAHNQMMPPQKMSVGIDGREQSILIKVGYN